MDIYKNILNKVIIMTLFLSVFSGCQNKNVLDEKFPLDSNEYPKINIVNIDGINREFNYNYNTNEPQNAEIIISGNSKNEIKVILSQGLPIHLWMADEQISGARLKNSKKYLPDENKKYDKEGQSAYLQEFIYEITDKETFKGISFKKVNIDYAALQYIFELNILID